MIEPSATEKQESVREEWRLICQQGILDLKRLERWMGRVQWVDEDQKRMAAAGEFLLQTLLEYRMWRERDGDPKGYDPYDPFSNMQEESDENLILRMPLWALPFMMGSFKPGSWRASAAMILDHMASKDAGFGPASCPTLPALAAVGIAGRQSSGASASDLSGLLDELESRGWKPPRLGQLQAIPANASAMVAETLCLRGVMPEPEALFRALSSMRSHGDRDWPSEAFWRKALGGLRVDRSPDHLAALALIAMTSERDEAALGEDFVPRLLGLMPPEQLERMLDPGWREKKSSWELASQSVFEEFDLDKRWPKFLRIAERQALINASRRPSEGAAPEARKALRM